jgi:phosphoenolpyruvate synthase/pyruvate phosphate dikinase
VRLRQEVGISLDDCYMGVIVQEEIPSQMGGVLVTTNPMNQAGDFRNVYVNVSLHSDAAKRIVTGTDTPNQYLYNTVEGAGRTLSIGESGVDLTPEQKNKLQTLALCGRLLQSHYSPDYTFSTPLDIEWIADENGALYMLQARPYKK